MKVWTITSTSYNGEYDVSEIVGIFTDRARAARVISMFRDRAGKGPYSTTYEMD